MIYYSYHLTSVVPPTSLVAELNPHRRQVKIYAHWHDLAAMQKMCIPLLEMQKCIDLKYFRRDFPHEGFMYPQSVVHMKCIEVYGVIIT